MSPQFPTLDDIRRLLACVNALHPAVPMQRATLLSQRLMTILEAAAVAVDGQEADGRMVRLGFTAVMPACAEATPTIEPTVANDRAATQLTCHPPAAGPAGGRMAELRSTFERDGRVSIIVAQRPTAFEDRHATLLQILHPHVAWAVEHVHVSINLPDGPKAVLELMLTGMSEKQIAKRIGRNAHTVHGYVKRVYKHFAVRSRPALIARFYVPQAAEGQ